MEQPQEKDRIEKRTKQFVTAIEGSDQKHLTDLLMFTNDQELSDIIDTLTSNKWILPAVCDLGFLDVLRIIYAFGIMDINADYKGKTGLQYACQHGHLDVVQWLLDHKALLNKSLWKEDSEFFLATINGQQDVINILLSSHAELAPDISVCYCLLYAACCGGHIELAKKWFAPGIDVREKIAFTTDLSNCEHKYPLFAACEGEHFEVAEFLINECGAALTADICQHFPQFTTKLVRSLYLSSDTKHLLNFKMANSKIECILPCWFSAENERLKTKPDVSSEDKEDANEEEETLFEIVIDLRGNRLGNVPGEVLLTMRELVSLDVSYNPLRTISVSSALDSSVSALNQLKILNFSHCELESLSHHIFDLPCLEQLNLSYNKLVTLGVREENFAAKSTGWKCTRLHSLNVSHNLLTTFPTGMQTCADLNTLIASYNQLTAACTPWECPMKLLDLSNNKLTSFAPSADQYWKQTLKRLHLQSNQITELPESVVNMRLLTYLDVSDNNIQQVPSPNLWSCPLIFFNLNDNQLGTSKAKTPFQKITSLNNAPAPRALVFPKSCLAATLMELYLSNNDLRTVPNGISDLENLSVLDLSENIRITELPIELGKLKKLLNLKLVGITVKDKELQGLISSLENSSRRVFARDVIKYLERKRRNCVQPDILKIVVLGCKKKNGPCIVQKLANPKDTGSLDHENLTVTRMTPKQKKSLTYEIWEVPDMKVTSAILPCFLTLNSLYVIVHDVCFSGADLHSVSEKISSIQACVFRPKIIVVCTYSKAMDKSVRVKLEKEIATKSQYGFLKAKFISVTLAAKENVDPLPQEIYSAWETMGDAVYEKHIKLHTRQVPEMFVHVANSVRTLQQNICRMDEFLQAVGRSRQDLEDGIDENLKLHEFLLQVGAILHYNIQMGELSDSVILNPTWLFKVLSNFLKSLTNLNDTKIAQLPISDVKAKLQDELPNGDYDYFPAFLKLLETFNIGIRISDSANKKDELLLVPCRLPKQPPQFQIDAHKDAYKAARLYCFPGISPVLWSHVISQLILAFERSSSSKWKLGEKKSNSSATVDRTKSFRVGCTVSLKGLNIYNKNIQFWRTGIMMHYDQGHVVVEQVACTYGSEKPEPGILITVQTTGSLKKDIVEQVAENTKKLSMMGIVTDELDEILELFNPKFRDSSQLQSRQTYTLCPLCYDIKPGTGCVNLEQVHFKVRECTQALLSRDAISCPKGHTLLAHLVPEFLFLELPPELLLAEEDLELCDVKLGHGMAGSVTKGIYKGTEVAVKIFNASTVLSSSYEEDDDDYGPYQNVCFVDTMATLPELSRKKQDELETEQLKISNAFTEVRREVGVLSKLRHEFVVTFIGLCVRPQVLLVMELAPLGSLRSELNTRTKFLFQELENPDTVISEMIFSKDLTYKIILQIGTGLSYLHKNSVIYRDLKPDNILLFSLSTEDRVNIKLSDYGISKFVTLQGVTGLFGTPGYMAPEVVARQPYTEQADIYSYAIVMLEVLTGLPPSEQLQSHQVSCTTDWKIIPKHIRGRKIHTNFHYLQNLMEDCWNVSMDERPSAKNVVKRMKADQFLLLHDFVWLGRNAAETLTVTCIYACQNLGRWNIWISESGCGNHRYFSVYDVASSGFSIHRHQCHGPQVVDMTKVGSRIWLVCKDLDNLQVIVRRTQNKFDVCHGVSLEARATQILNHSKEASEDSDSFLLVGLEDGCVTAYHFNTCHKKSVTVFTRIEFSRGVRVAHMCSINQNMIAVACGMAVFFLRVEWPDIERVCGIGKKGILIPELINYGSVSLNNDLSISEPVDSLVAEGNAVWCSSSSCLVKVDVERKAVEQAVTLSWKPSLDSVLINEIKGNSSSQTGQGATDSQGASKNLGKDTRNFTFGGFSRTGGNDSGFTEASMPSTAKTSIDDSFSYDPHLRHPDSYTNQNARSHSENSSDSQIPPVPLRYKLKKSTSSLPGFGSQQSSSNAGFYQEVALPITSLMLSLDTLVVGTSCGGIILFPLLYKHKTNNSGSLPSLPFLLPMLRHPVKAKEQRPRLGTLTSISSAQIDSSTGSISKLVLAGDKLVSHHSIHSQVRPNSKHAGYKREGSAFTAELADFCILDIPGAKNEGKPSDTSHTGSQSSLPELPATLANATPADPLQCEVADIAVWDNLTRTRLKTVRSFGHELVNCMGLCCESPDRSMPSQNDDMFS